MPWRGQKALVGLHQDVEDRIADPENVVFCVQSSSVLFTALRERLRPTQIGPAPGKLALSRSAARASRRMRPLATSFETPFAAPQDDGPASATAAYKRHHDPLLPHGLLPARWPRGLLGFVRDSAVAALLGAGAVADAFLVGVSAGQCDDGGC